MHGTTLFTGRGDVTIAWDEPDDPAILQMIEAQMKAGTSFFVIEPRLSGMAAPAKVLLQNPRDALRQRVVAMSLAGSDRELLSAIEGGAAQPVATPKQPAKTRRRAATAKEVASSETIGVRAARGG